MTDRAAVEAWVAPRIPRGYVFVGFYDYMDKQLFDFIMITTLSDTGLLAWRNCSREGQRRIHAAALYTYVGMRDATADDSVNVYVYIRPMTPTELLTHETEG